MAMPDIFLWRMNVYRLLSLHRLIDYGLRDYKVNGQIGLEKSIDDYISNIVEVFREVKRVLRSDGTVWLNLGDSYAGGKTGRYDIPDIGFKNNNIPTGFKHKDLLGIP